MRGGLVRRFFRRDRRIWRVLLTPPATRAEQDPEHLQSSQARGRLTRAFSPPSLESEPDGVPPPRPALARAGGGRTSDSGWGASYHDGAALAADPAAAGRGGEQPARPDPRPSSMGARSRAGAGYTRGAVLTSASAGGALPGPCLVLRPCLLGGAHGWPGTLRPVCLVPRGNALLVDRHHPQPCPVGVRGRVLPIDADEAYRLVRIASGEVVGNRAFPRARQRLVLAVARLLLGNHDEVVVVQLEMIVEHCDQDLRVAALAVIVGEEFAILRVVDDAVVAVVGFLPDVELTLR